MAGSLGQKGHISPRLHLVLTESRGGEARQALQPVRLESWPLAAVGSESARGDNGEALSLLNSAVRSREHLTPQTQMTLDAAMPRQALTLKSSVSALPGTNFGIGHLSC